MGLFGWGKAEFSASIGSGEGDRLTRETSLPKAAALILLGALAAALVIVVVSGRGASAAPRAVSEDASLRVSSAGDKGDLAARQTLRRYAEDTWASFVAMTDSEIGLPAARTGGWRAERASSSQERRADKLRPKSYQKFGRRPAASLRAYSSYIRFTVSGSDSARSLLWSASFMASKRWASVMSLRQNITLCSSRTQM